MKKTGIFILAVFFGLGVFAYDSFVLMKLWEWFVCPTFSMDGLMMPQAMGLTLLVTHNLFAPEYRDKARMSTTNAIYKPTLILFLGWIVQHWMA